MDDPSNYLPAANDGKPPLLKLQNISARPELNGQFGQAVSYADGRYVVALLDAATAAAAAGAGGGGSTGNNAQPTFLKLKPENLTTAGSIDQLIFGAGMFVESAKAYVAGPTVQAYGKRIVAKLPPAMQSKVTPNQALLGVAVAAQTVFLFVYYVIGRFMGFTKLFTLVSFAALILSVSSPDWMEGYKANKPMKLIMRGAATNFPRRWKENLINATGYTNISDKMSLASLVLALLIWGKILLTPTPSPPRVPDMPMGSGMQGAPHIIPPPKYDLEHIYKLGFDDAKSGNEFGTSLPEDIIKYNAQEESLPPRYDNADNFDWAYNPPPPPPKKSSLGMGMMLSMFTLYRFGKETFTGPDGRVVLEPAYMMAQLRNMEPWRLGLMGMSLYRVVTGLSSFVR
eukprot:CAMPEP_0183715392 /NCGR_PEP_ID=MMETSP0737-20130205/9631_1 /TAXON_ID=385413 /ORGANISM="Thalassiosira miniscula, Strain CCMP1093" /LENGTH=398 /DNA_ID=CAMNT_0025944483 /DNA_START=28 /DNA_END=1224 /DNA_ORIENTATION=-